MNSTLLFSPHADDVVLSCFAPVLAPNLANVVTVFAGVPADPDLLAGWDRRLGARSSQQIALQRLREDAAAFAQTGARLRIWHYLDEQYRSGPPDRAALVADMRAAMTDVDEVWLPAGICDHPDHVQVRDCGLTAAEACAADRPLRVRLYAEYPYQLFQMSRRHKAAGTYASFDWLNHDPAALAEWFSERFPVPGDPELTVLTPDAVAAKARSIRCHGSQLAELDRQVYGTLLNDANLRREYWWPVEPGHNRTRCRQTA
jgi:LmbE family N-acetylglucosaminyl deacetylase